MKKTVLVTGCEGQLVSDLIDYLQQTGKYTLVCYNRQTLDVTNYTALAKAFKDIRPNIYIHGPSVHNVEHFGDDIDNACHVNIGSLYHASLLCNEYECALINFSTNYIFDGTQSYQYGMKKGHVVDTPVFPVNVYGISKYAGERVVSQVCKRGYNIRVSGVFGKVGSRAKNGDNFIYVILRSLKENGEAKVVNDQTLNVTYTVDAAVVIEKIIECLPYGKTWHVVNKGVVTWYDVARFVAIIKGYSDSQVVPITTEDFYSEIKRPAHTALSIEETESVLGVEIPTWQSAVVRFLREVREIQ